MLIDNVNLNHLRVFECVYRTRSMTMAAKELHLTQSGVSQHIKSLEDVLEVKLFDRINQRLVPTERGKILFSHCDQGLRVLEGALHELRGRPDELFGTVSLGVPVEFGQNVLLPIIAEFGRNHSNVSFDIRMGFAHEMNDWLLEGEVDIAFVDEYRMHRSVVTKPLYDEVLELCVLENLYDEILGNRSKKTKENIQDLKKFPYVSYETNMPILKLWFSHHLGEKSPHLLVKATVSDVQGVAALILNGLVAGILPGHLTDRLIAEGRPLVRFKGKGDWVKNKISLAQVLDRTLSPATQELLKFVKKKLTSASKQG